MSHFPSILYVGSGRDILEIIVKAKDAGFHVVYLCKPSEVKQAVKQLVDEQIEIDYGDREALLELGARLHERFGFVTALSLNESALIAAAQLREGLGLPGNSLATVQLLRDKSRMREHLNDLDISRVDFRKGNSKADIVQYCAEHRLPAIIKPTDQSGSYGVFKISCESEIDAILEKMSALAIESFIIEEYLDGNEISIEAFSHDGQHQILCHTQKFTNETFVEMGHAVPASLDEATRREIDALLVRFLDAIGLTYGPTHTEMRLTAAGPKIIESHARTGGDRINELVRLAYSVDMRQLAFAKLLPGSAAIQPLFVSPVAIRFLVAPPGRIQAIEGLDRVESEAEEVRLAVQVGQLIGPLHDSLGRCGHVIARGQTLDEAIMRSTELAGSLVIKTCKA